MTGQLNEQYFDALLSAAFSRYEQIENDKLPSDEELASRGMLPEKELRSVLKYQKRKDRAERSRQSVAGVYIRRAAVIVLATVAVAFGALMFNSEVRAAVGRAVVEFFELFVKIEVQPEADTTPQSEYSANVTKTVAEYELGYYPEGFEIENQNIMEGSKEYILTSPDGDYIHVFFGYSSAVALYSDDEFRSFDSFSIDGCQEAYIMVDKEEEPPFKTIYALSDNIAIIVEGYNDSSELSKIVESIIK